MLELSIFQHVLTVLLWIKRHGAFVVGTSPTT